MPRVSVIIPTYRRPHLLGAAIQSVLNQTYQDFEIVVVDDHSGDDTEAVVSAFHDPRVRYIGHRTNWRVAAARNTGLLNSSGEFVAFLDDDDEWLPEKLGRQLEVFDQRSRVTGAVYTGFAMINRMTGRTATIVRPKRSGHILHRLCQNNCVGTASTLVLRRECFDEVGLFDETIDFGEEYDMWIRIAHSYDFAYLPEPLVRYSVHSVRLSTSSPVTIRGLHRQLSKYGAFFAIYPGYLSDRYVALGVAYCREKNIKEARRAFWRAVQIAPGQLRNYLYLGLGLIGAWAVRALRRLYRN